MADPWVVLGIDTGTPLEEARRAYLMRLQLVHPDHHQGAGEDVLAEADRATRALTEAWAAVQAYHGTPVPPPGPRRSGPGGSGPRGSAPPPPSRTGSRPPEGARACLRWAVDRLIAAGEEEGRPLRATEVELLVRPLVEAPTGRGFQRWLVRRRATLAVAVARDGADAWSAAVRTLHDGGPTAVLTLLFERR